MIGMKKINLFLAIGDKELKADRNELTNFVRSLNDKLEKFDVYLKIITETDHLDGDILQIENSEILLLILNKSIAENTIKEFDHAYQKFLGNHMPKISTYIKKGEQDSSVIHFMKKLDEELGHYYSQYENLDTIKLNLVLLINHLGLELDDIDVKEGKLCIGDEEILSLENIPMILHNDNMIALKQELRKIDEEFWETKEKLSENPDNKNLQEDYEKIKSQRKQVKETIFDLQKDVLILEKNFVEKTAQGLISKRQLYAKKCLDEGKIEEAKEVLNIQRIKQEAKKLSEMKESNTIEGQILRNELLQLANTHKLDLKDKQRFEKIEEAYEEAVELEEKLNIKRSATLSYGLYLVQQKRYQKALEKFEKYFAYEKMTGDFEINIFSTVFAVIYAELGYFDKAEELYHMLIKYYENKIEQGEQIKKNKENLVRTLDSFSTNVLEIQNRVKEAEEIRQKSIELLKSLPEQKGLLAEAYAGLASVYAASNREEQAYELYDESIMMIEKDNDQISPNHLFVTYCNYAYVLKKLKKYEKAEEMVNKAIVIAQKLMEENAEAFEDKLAEAYSTLAGIKLKQCKPLEAEEYYLKSIEIHEKIQNKYGNHEKRLGRDYNNIGLFYQLVDQMDEMFYYMEKAKEIYEKLYQQNENAFLNTLCAIYINLAGNYENYCDYEKAEYYYVKAIDKIEAKLEENFYVYANTLATACNNLGYMYFKIKKLDLAENNVQKAIALKEVLIEGNVTIHNEELESSKELLADIQEYKERDPLLLEAELQEEAMKYENDAMQALQERDIFKMKRAYTKAKGIYKELVKMNPVDVMYPQMLKTVEGRVDEINQMLNARKD